MKRAQSFKSNLLLVGRNKLKLMARKSALSANYSVPVWTKYAVMAAISIVILVVEYLQSVNYEITSATIGAIVLIVAYAVFNDLESYPTPPTPPPSAKT